MPATTPITKKKTLFWEPLHDGATLPSLRGRAPLPPGIIKGRTAPAPQPPPPPPPTKNLSIPFLIRAEVFWKGGGRFFPAIVPSRIRAPYCKNPTGQLLTERAPQYEYKTNYWGKHPEISILCGSTRVFWDYWQKTLLDDLPGERRVGVNMKNCKLLWRNTLKFRSFMVVIVFFFYLEESVL